MCFCCMEAWVKEIAFDFVNGSVHCAKLNLKGLSGIR